MHSHKLCFSIATAETVSTITSFGAVWLTTSQKNMVAFLEPAKNFLAEKILYPLCGGKTNEDKEKAIDKASVLLKGVIMMGTDFVTTVGTQMIVEGELSKRECIKAAKGKLLGMTASLITVEILNKSMPGIMQKVEDEIIKKLPQFTKKEPLDGSDLDKEIANLIVIAIPSSIISSMVSYLTQSRGMGR